MEYFYLSPVVWSGSVGFVFSRLLWFRIFFGFHKVAMENTPCTHHWTNVFFFTCVISVAFVTVNNRSRFRLLEQQLLHLFIRIIALLCPLILATIFLSSGFFTLHGTGTGNSRWGGTGAMFPELSLSKSSVNITASHLRIHWSWSSSQSRVQSLSHVVWIIPLGLKVWVNLIKLFLQKFCYKISSYELEISTIVPLKETTHSLFLSLLYSQLCFQFDDYWE